MFEKHGILVESVFRDGKGKAVLAQVWRDPKFSKTSRILDSQKFAT
jgi:hypothetical protein